MAGSIFIYNMVSGIPRLSIVPKGNVRSVKLDESDFTLGFLCDNNNKDVWITLEHITDPDERVEVLNHTIQCMDPTYFEQHSTLNVIEVVEKYRLRNQHGY